MSLPLPSAMRLNVSVRFGASFGACGQQYNCARAGRAILRKIVILDLPHDYEFMGHRTGSISCIETSLDLHSMNQFLIELTFKDSKRDHIRSVARSQARVPHRGGVGVS